MTRLGNYTKAVLNWYILGRPVRSDEEVENLLKICKDCEHFNHEKSICSVCGCRLNLSRHAEFNKLRMATEHCPKGKW